MMKRYKLLKDLPGVKAGAIFHRYTNEIMQVDVLKRVDDQGIFLPPSFDVSSVHNFNEWFKEINSKLTINDIDWNFDPKPGDICYSVDNAGNILSRTHAAEEKAEVAMGNRFRTKQEAEAYRQWLKAVAELRRSSNFKADWEDTTEDKWYVYYDYDYHSLSVDYNNHSRCQSLVYYGTRDDAVLSIEEHGGSWLTYFGVREED